MACRKTGCGLSELRCLYLCDNVVHHIRQDKLENDVDIQVKISFHYVPGGTTGNHEHFGIGGLQVEFLTREQLPECE